MSSPPRGKGSSQAGEQSHDNKNIHAVSVSSPRSFISSNRPQGGPKVRWECCSCYQDNEKSALNRPCPSKYCSHRRCRYCKTIALPQPTEPSFNEPIEDIYNDAMTDITDTEPSDAEQARQKIATEHTIRWECCRCYKEVEECLVSWVGNQWMECDHCVHPRCERCIGRASWSEIGEEPRLPGYWERLRREDLKVRETGKR